MRSTFVIALAFASSAVAQINVPGSVPVNKLEPLQHRLAYAGTTGMTVSWNTYEKVDEPTVYYGTDSWDLSSYATGESVTFQTSLTWSNHVKVTGLQPNTQYFYVVSNTNCYNCSELYIRTVWAATMTALTRTTSRFQTMSATFRILTTDGASSRSTTART
ncbi:purple acid phosphatase-like protein [Lipomyces tetrasporus]